MKWLPGLLLSLLLLTGCGGLNLSQSYPGAKDFHPRVIVVLPVSAGNYELAREVIETVLAQSLVKTGWYEQVIEPKAIRARLAESPQLLEEVGDYIVRLNTLGISNKLSAQKVGENYQAQALLVATVTDWGYERVAGDKAAQVGFNLILVDAGSGDLVWKASHKGLESYVMFRPKLEDVAAELLKTMLKEMPH